MTTRAMAQLYQNEVIEQSTIYVEHGKIVEGVKRVIGTHGMGVVESVLLMCRYEACTERASSTQFEVLHKDVLECDDPTAKLNESVRRELMAFCDSHSEHVLANWATNAE